MSLSLPSWTLTKALIALRPQLPELLVSWAQWNGLYEEHVRCTLGYESPWCWGFTFQGLDKLHICRRISSPTE